MTDDSGFRALSQLHPVDHDGRLIEPGSVVRVVAVSSCARGLPEDDQARLRGIVGQLRLVAKLDDFGFVWLSFDDHCAREDFCLMPVEVEVV